MSGKWASEHIIVNGIKLHYNRTGGDKPPLVLSHGITDNGLCWTPLACVLEKEYDVIMYDKRGHGLSDAPDGGYNYRQLAADRGHRGFASIALPFGELGALEPHVPPKFRPQRIPQQLYPRRSPPRLPRP